MSATTFKLDRHCIICGTRKTLDIPVEGWRRWRQGTLIQKAMPSLSRTDRELLLSGLCASCFDSTFADSPSTPEPHV